MLLIGSSSFCVWKDLYYTFILKDFFLTFLFILPVCSKFVHDHWPMCACMQVCAVCTCVCKGVHVCVMCMQVNVYVGKCMYMRGHVCACVCMLASVCACMCAWKCACSLACVCICVSICACASVCMHVTVCMFTGPCACEHACVHACMRVRECVCMCVRWHLVEVLCPSVMRVPGIEFRLSSLAASSLYQWAIPYSTWYFAGFRSTVH